MRGPKPELRVIEGGEGAAAVADVPTPALQAPPSLPAELHADWDQIVSDLQARRLFQVTMLGTIEQYLIARWGVRRAQAAIEEHGELIKGKDGTLKANPALGLLRTSQDTAARLAAELGLTPTSRSRKTLVNAGRDLFSDPQDGFDL